MFYRAHKIQQNVSIPLKSFVSTLFLVTRIASLPIDNQKRLQEKVLFIVGFKLVSLE